MSCYYCEKFVLPPLPPWLFTELTIQGYSEVEARDLIVALENEKGMVVLSLLKEGMSERLRAYLLQATVARSLLLPTRRLLELGANPDITTYGPGAPLAGAQTGAMAYLLLEHGADPNGRSVSYGRDLVLHTAIRYGRTSVVSQLLMGTAGGPRANPNYCSNLSPVQMAVAGNHVDILRLLFQAGAELDPSLLHLGVQHNSLECVRYLLRHLYLRSGGEHLGAPVYSIDSEGRTPYQLALELCGVDSAIARLLASPYHKT